MHTKKTNNTNKLIQISYHFVLTKIQKLQNLKKKKKKTFFLYWPVRPVPAGIARNWPVRPVFFPVRNRGVECTGLLAGTVYSGRYGTILTSMVLTNMDLIMAKTHMAIYVVFLNNFFFLDIIGFESYDFTSTMITLYYCTCKLDFYSL